MKNPSRLKVLLPALLLFLIVSTSACREAESETTEDAPSAPGVIEITAADYAFDAPAEIPSGWITYRLNNEKAHEIHEVSLARLPEGKTHEEYVTEVIPVWETLWEQMQAGEIASAAEIYEAAGQQLPDWADDIAYVRSRGLVSPGRSTRNTLYLEPGTYSIDCWVKAPDGRIHLAQGMSRPLVVTEEDSGASEPEADVEITISGGEIVTAGELTPGDHTIALLLEEGFEHDNIHLVHLEEDTDLAEVARWMDWYWEGGLRAPAPADFFGGAHAYGTVPRGNAAYFSVENLEPGRYAWIVEAPAEDEMWQTFTIERTPM